MENNDVSRAGFPRKNTIDCLNHSPVGILVERRNEKKTRLIRLIQRVLLREAQGKNFRVVERAASPRCANIINSEAARDGKAKQRPRQACRIN